MVCKKSGPTQQQSLHGRGDNGEATSIRSSCAPARCFAAATCAPRTSGRPSFMDSGDHGSSATFSRPAWPQAAAVARGARAWLREVVIMSELGLIAPAARFTMHRHHLVHRRWEEHPRTWCFAGAPVEAHPAQRRTSQRRGLLEPFFHAARCSGGICWPRLGDNKQQQPWSTCSERLRSIPAI